MNIGIVLNNLAASQLAFEVINQANKLSFDGKYECILFPVIPSTICLHPNVAILNLAETYNFDGILIATDLYTASLVASTKNNARKLFYIWDLEWLRGKVNYIENLKIYRDSNLEIICRSEPHQKILQNYCNIKARIVEDCNILNMVENEIK